jgi:hypothetical protein
MRIRFVKLAFALCGVIGLTSLAISTGGAGTPSDKGIGGIMPALYDGDLFSINFMELSSEGTLQTKNGQLNNIYQSDAGLPGGQPFISVIDAIPTDGMNPLWEEIQITFTAGHTPRQLGSDDEITAAVASGEITLTDTGELYRCSVIGKVVPTSVASAAAKAATWVAGTSAKTAATNGRPRAGSWGGIKRIYR